MEFIEYALKEDNKIYVDFYGSKFINVQPTNNEECILMTLSIIAFSDSMKKLNKQYILTIDCKNVNINKLSNITYLIYITNELHKHTKNDKYLEKIYVKNCDSKLQTLYETTKPILPSFINKLIHFV